MPKTSEANLRAIKKYQEKNIKQFKFGFNKTNDADIIEWLENTPNKLGYIKELIRADIAKQKKDS